MLIDFHLIVYCFFPSKFCFNICLALSLVLYPDGLWDVLPTLYPAALSIFLSTKVFSEYINQQLVYTFRMWFIFNLDMIKWCSYCQNSHCHFEQIWCPIINRNIICKVWYENFLSYQWLGSVIFKNWNVNSTTKSYYKS